jgi:hypothetical protein
MSSDIMRIILSSEGQVPQGPDLISWGLAELGLPKERWALLLAKNIATEQIATQIQLRT